MLSGAWRTSKRAEKGRDEREPTATARPRSHPPSTRSFRARPLLSHPTVSIRAQLLVCHLLHVLLSPIARFRPNRVSLSSSARLPPGPCLFKLERSSPTHTMFLRARALVSRLNHVFSNWGTRHSPQPCPFKPLPGLCLFKLECLSPTLTSMFLRA